MKIKQHKRELTPEDFRKLSVAGDGHFKRDITLKIRKADIDSAARIIRKISFSSETEEVTRHYGIEILGHDKGEVRLERLNNKANVLFNHDPDRYIGVIVEGSAKTDSKDRKNRCDARFGKSDFADQIFRDVEDEILVNVSVGYIVYHATMLEKDEETGQSKYRIDDWEPYEVSIVTIPADTTVGVGRSASKEAKIKERGNTPGIQEKEERKTMFKCPKCGYEAARDIHGECPGCIAIRQAAEKAKEEAEKTTRIKVEQEYKEKQDRERKINKICDLHKVPAETRRQFLESNKSYEEVTDELVNAAVERGELKKLKTSGSSDIFMSTKEQRELGKRYHIGRAILSCSKHGKGIDAGYEKELSDEMTRICGIKPGGIWVPNNVLKRAAAPVSLLSQSSAAVLVTDDVQKGSYIDILRNKLVAEALGIRVINDAVGNFVIFKKTGTGVAYYVASQEAPSASATKWDGITMSPKKFKILEPYDKDLLLQVDSLDIHQTIINDLTDLEADKRNDSLINADGSAGKPTGLLYLSGIGDVAGGANGAAPTYDHLVDLEGLPADANAKEINQAYLTNSKVRKKLKKTKLDAGSGLFVWDRRDRELPLNGHKTVVSNAVPSNLDKGTSTGVCSAIFYSANWSDIMEVLWGGLEITVDDITQAGQDIVNVYGTRRHDLGYRRAESFAAMKDALTT